MSDPCEQFKSQYKKAKETLDILLIQRTEINLKLKSDFSNPHLQKELRAVNMDIRITENEMEHAEYRIQECEIKNQAPISKNSGL
ncbi:MAG TPA: hypothetical protein VIV55_09715 [Flavobacterium sp.]